MAGAQRHQSLAFRTGRPLVDARLEVAGNGLEQLATGPEFTLPAGYEVLETTGERVQLCIAAHLHYICAAGRVLGVSVEGHLGCGWRQVPEVNVAKIRRKAMPGCQRNVADSSQYRTTACGVGTGKSVSSTVARAPYEQNGRFAAV